MKKKILIVLCCLALLAISAGAIFGFVLKKDAPPPEPLAPIIAEFEEKRAEEIASFKEKNPAILSRRIIVQAVFSLHFCFTATTTKLYPRIL